MTAFELIRAILELVDVDHAVWHDNYGRPAGLSSRAVWTDGTPRFAWSVTFQHNGSLLFWYA